MCNHFTPPGLKGLNDSVHHTTAWLHSQHSWRLRRPTRAVDSFRLPQLSRLWDYNLERAFIDIRLHPRCTHNWSCCQPLPASHTLRPNVTSSIKPEIHNVAQRCRRWTEPWPQGICTPNFVQISSAVPVICSRTDRHTDRWVNRNTPHPYWDRVTSFLWTYNTRRWHYPGSVQVQLQKLAFWVCIWQNFCLKACLTNWLTYLLTYLLFSSNWNTLFQQ